MKLSIFTSMTNPEQRKDPWKEATKCYEDFADELTIVGKNWPEEFSFDYIGQVFQEGFKKSTGDWVIHMDIDNFFHQKDKEKLRKILKKYSDFPAVAFPKFQFFQPKRYNLKAKMCIALNKKQFPNIQMNGGGDVCQPTLDGKLISPENVPYEKIAIWNYDSVFKTKKIISHDRARFARAWHSYFGDYGDRGGPTEKEAFDAWLNMIKKRYSYHYLRMKIENHPKYIINKLNDINEEQFGYNLFGIEENIKKLELNKLKDTYKNYIKNYLIVK